MRIGIDVRMAYYTQAGIGQYIRRLVEGLSKIETAEEIILLPSRKDRLFEFNHSVFRHRSLWTPSHNRFEQFTLPLEIALARLHVLHSPDFIPPFRRNCRSVITVHDLAFLRFPHFLTPDSARYYSQIDRAVRHADHIIAVSESTRQDLIQSLGVPEEKLSVIHEAPHRAFQPINNPALLAATRERHNLIDPFILTVSTIEPRKNLVTLLRAFRLFIEKSAQPAQLAVVGKPGWLYEDVFRAVEELGLQDAVRFLGRVPPEELVYLYNAAAVHVHPALYEGFGLPPLEAMTCGTPTIVSNTSSLPEVVGEAGLLVEPEDVEAWAAAMNKVLSNADLRAQMRWLGLRQAARFSIEKMAHETLTVYRKVAQCAS